MSETTGEPIRLRFDERQLQGPPSRSPSPYVTTPVRLDYSPDPQGIYDLTEQRPEREERNRRPILQPLRLSRRRPRQAA